jgi:hypothetical protein
MDLSAVVHGTIVGTDSIQVGFFSRTPEGAAEAAHNYLWALAGSDDPSVVLKQIAAPDRAGSLTAAAQRSKDLLLEQFYLGFRTVQPTVQIYDVDAPTITLPVTGVPFGVRLRWINGPTGGDWKLSSIQRLNTVTPAPQPAPS